MLLLHLGIPPSGHGYAPPIAVAIITVLAKKGLYSAEMHLRVYYSSAPSLSKNFPSMAKKPYWLLNLPREDTTPLRRFQTFKGNARPTPTGGTELPTGATRFSFPFLRIQNSLSRNRLLQALPSDSSLLHSPRFPAYLFTKRKGRKSVLNIRGWTPSLLFPVELVMFLTMFPFIKEIRLFVPAHGAVNQTGDVFF